MTFTKGTLSSCRSALILNGFSRASSQLMHRHGLTPEVHIMLFVAAWMLRIILRASRLAWAPKSSKEWCAAQAAFVGDGELRPQFTEGTAESLAPINPLCRARSDRSCRLLSPADPFVLPSLQAGEVFSRKSRPWRAACRCREVTFMFDAWRKKSMVCRVICAPREIRSESRFPPIT